MPEETNFNPVIIAAYPVDKLKLTAFFPAISPDQLFAYWTEPTLLVQWWPQEVVQLETKNGGSYHFSWPQMNWQLKGQFSDFVPAKRLSFSWHWEHEPEVPTRQVLLTFEEQARAGTLLTLEHSHYTNLAKDQAERQGHIEGWQFFIGKLYQLLEPNQA